MIHIPAICITADRTEEVAKAVADEDALLLNKPLKPAALRATLKPPKVSATLRPHLEGAQCVTGPPL